MPHQVSGSVTVEAILISIDPDAHKAATAAAAAGGLTPRANMREINEISLEDSSGASSAASSAPGSPYFGATIVNSESEGGAGRATSSQIHDLPRGASFSSLAFCHPTPPPHRPPSLLPPSLSLTLSISPSLSHTHTYTRS